jgi:hypothetical protein
MRKLMMVITFAIALLSVTGAATAMDAPTCGDSCPFVR